MLAITHPTKHLNVLLLTPKHTQSSSSSLWHNVRLSTCDRLDIITDSLLHRAEALSRCLLILSGMVDLNCGMCFGAKIHSGISFHSVINFAVSTIAKSNNCDCWIWIYKSFRNTVAHQQVLLAGEKNKYICQHSQKARNPDSIRLLRSLTVCYR